MRRNEKITRGTMTGTDDWTTPNRQEIVNDLLEAESELHEALQGTEISEDNAIPVLQTYDSRVGVLNDAIEYLNTGGSVEWLRDKAIWKQSSVQESVGDSTAGESVNNGVRAGWKDVQYSIDEHTDRLDDETLDEISQRDESAEEGR